MDTAKFTPTPAQIAAGCAAARAGWSAVDRARALRGRGEVGLSRIFGLCRERAERRSGRLRPLTPPVAVTSRPPGRPKAPGEPEAEAA